MVRRSKLGASVTLALVSMLGLPGQLRADPFTLSIATPNFLIPLAGQNGTLTVYSDGRAAQTSGFNALGSQTFFLGANSTSTGYLTLNLFFSGMPLGDPNHTVDDAQIQFTVRDLDFLTDQVTQRVTLREMAIIRAVNGDTLASPINLASYLPAGTTTTDDRTITLRPIDLMPPLSSSDFTDPFILSLRLTATATNTGSYGVWLRNTPEAILAAARLDINASPSKVPEPGSLLLIGLGLVAAAYRKSRTRA